MTADREPRTVVTGEALVDIVLARDGSLSGHPGGGPYNVARTIARLDQPVAYLGRVSTDGFGTHLRRTLEADGVDCDTIVATDAPTTLALAELDAGGAARYRFYTAGTSAPGLAIEAATAVLPERIGAFYVGTLGLVLEPMASTLESLVGRMDEATIVAVDPNCRPVLIDDPAGYRGRLDRVLARADIVKASEEDLAWLDPGADPVTAARRLIAQEHAVALVTLGGRGALVVTTDDAIAVASPAVEVVDTIGAGDAFMGALLAWLRESGVGRRGLTRVEDVVQAAEFACRVAAITCSRAGADPPRRAELEPHGASPRG